MKYKVLVMGKSNSIIDDFFIQMADSFEVVSTSTRYGDIIRHLKFFAPDVLVYCLYNEANESIRQMVTIKPMLQQSRIPLMLVGSKEDCDEFERIAVDVAAVTYVKPFTASTLREKIEKYLDERQPYVEEYRSKNGTGESTSAEAESGRDDLAAVDISSLKDKLSSLEAALNQTAEAPAQETAAPRVAAPVNEAQDVSDDRKHILVIDDDPIMLKTVKEQLHDDYDVATAISGKIAMKFLERKRTDLILLDYEMPGENGPAVLGKIRDNDSSRDIPVVFLTGVSDRDKIKEAIALKPQGYLLKPIDHDKLMETINNYVR